MATLANNSKKYLEIVKTQPALHTMTPIEVRQLRKNAPKYIGSANLEKIEDKYIKMRDGERIKIRIYTPKGKGPFPIIIYYHGGGWVLNDIETCDASCQLLASTSQSIVVSVNYRLAPEYKFPIPVYDAYDAFLWTANYATMINGFTNSITVMGDSAGANLATVVTLMNKELKGPLIKSQILLYPVTELSYKTPSYYEFAQGYGLEREDMEWFGYHYLNSEEEKEHPYVAPLLAKDTANLPASLIIVAENDCLRDEGLAYGKKLKNSGVYVEQLIAKGLVHSFFTKNELFSNAIEKTIDTVASFLHRTTKQ